MVFMIWTGEAGKVRRAIGAETLSQISQKETEACRIIAASEVV
jgi:hypothetical protein